MKTTVKMISTLISTINDLALNTLAINNKKMPELIPVRVVTKVPHDQNR